MPELAARSVQNKRKFKKWPSEGAQCVWGCNHGVHRCTLGLHSCDSTTLQRMVPKHILHPLLSPDQSSDSLRRIFVLDRFPRQAASHLLGMSQRPLTLILLQKYRDTNGRRILIQIGSVYTTFCQEQGILSQQKYRDGNGRCIAILFKSIGVRGRFDSPDQHKRFPSICRCSAPHGRAP